MAGVIRVSTLQSCQKWPPATPIANPLHGKIRLDSEFCKRLLIEEMARIADFMEVLVDRAILAKLADSAGFEKMREEGMALIPRTAKLFRGEAERLFYKGRIGEWRGLFKQDDLELFEKKLGALPKEYAGWLIGGRSGLPLK